MKEPKPIAAFVADIHWMTRTPEYRRETGPFHEVIRAKLTTLAEFCRDSDIPAFVAGDLSDVSRDFMGLWTLREMLYEVFWPVGKQSVRLWIVPGQHDRFHHNPNERATTLNVLLSEDNDILALPDGGIRLDGNVAVWGCGWGETAPLTPTHYKNVLVTHKTLWNRIPVYPGQTEGNIAVEAAKYAALGYKMVFSGDNHRAFDATVGGVEFHNLGCLTRDDVRYKDQQPRFIVLYDDLSVESVNVGEVDVFDIERSDADKGREDKKDEFSEALAGGYEYGATFRGSLETIEKAGKCGELTFTDKQRRLLRDLINTI